MHPDHSGDVLSVDVLPFQIPVIHIWPPQPHEGNGIIVLAQDRLDLGFVFRADDHDQRALDIRCWILVEIDPIWIAAHIPPVWVAHIVVIRDNNIIANGSPFG